VSEARKVKFTLGELDLTLSPAMTYWDAKQLRGFAKLHADDHFAAIDMLVDILLRCALAGGSSVTREELEKHIVLPDGVTAIMAALFELAGPVVTVN
jgi:hypothetical protein